MTIKKENIACPICGKKGTWTAENKYKPFCSERCKITDLGEWASETRRVPGEPANPSELPDDDKEED